MLPQLLQLLLKLRLTLLPLALLTLRFARPPLETMSKYKVIKATEPYLLLSYTLRYLDHSHVKMLPKINPIPILFPLSK
jgi:hypothetical protein